MAFFSVIIPVYNIEKYLRNCLDSVVSQTFEDLEIILVDDGSTDSCPYICDTYAASDSRISVIHKSNGGLISARKAGARVATADYIACVDGDDWIELNYFEKFAEVIKKNASDIVCCGTIVQLNKGDTRQQKIKEKYGDYTKEDIIQYIYPHLISFSGSIWGKVFKRSIYMDIQFNLDERIKIGEDACVVLPCVYKAKSMFILEECLYNYRYNPSSMTKNRSVYNLKEPKLIAKHLIKNIDVQETWFKRQIYRSTVHRLFNRCISQFYQKKSFNDICFILDNCLDDVFYQKCINKSNISLMRSPKEWFAMQTLKNRMYLVMRIYSIIR